MRCQNQFEKYISRTETYEFVDDSYIFHYKNINKLFQDESRVNDVSGKIHEA